MSWKSQFEKLAAEDSLLEKLAELEHDRWSRWEKWRKRPEVTAEDEERWVRQRETPYAELSEKEKESDRKEARRTLELLRKMNAR